VITLLGLPIIAFLVIVQTSIISRLNISFGQADLVMLFILAWCLQDKNRVGVWWAVAGGIMMSFVSAVPWYAYLIGYVMISIISKILQKRLWNIPILTMVVLSFVGTMIVLVISFVFVSVTQIQLPIHDSLVKVILPSSALNMILSIPIFIIVRDLVNMVYPADVE
jgi:rod shape-determining protein MreD